ncbi:COG2958 family protein [Persicitalea sp.]|uniref:COG2958 family protein n=1 Tax=Persicitalea sp. TaxID=3100273 RepID=UPI003593EB86
MTFIELAERVLREEKIPLTANEIWRVAENKGYSSQLNSQGKTPWATLGAQIYVNERDNFQTPFAVVGKRPKRFYLKEQASLFDLEKIESTENTEEIPDKKSKIQYLEKDLHPFLVHFAYYHLKCYTKTINHSKSNKKEFGEWVHPDVVGCNFPIGEWSTEVLNLSSSVGNNSIKIKSFELKRELNLGSLRENFFQTVSNSSWANESYLVAAEISNNEDFLSELTRLSTSFGIGIIKLDIENPLSSEVILPARTRDNLDWETVNKLTLNKDFKDFLKRIKNDLTSNEIRKEKYDKVFEPEELIKLLKRKR